MLTYTLFCVNNRTLFLTYQKLINIQLMKIAHISDIHLCSEFKRNNIVKTKKLIKHAVEQSIDHLVITGDISDNAREKDFLILKKILETYNMFHSDKTTVVIGNHDIFGGVQTANDIINFPSKCLNTNYKEKVDRFVNIFKELFEDTYSPVENHPFPFVKVMGHVVLIGLNTIDKYSKLKNTFASNGHVSNLQREALNNILAMEQFKNKQKIILAHHHFNKSDIETKSSESFLWNHIESFTMKLRGKKKLFKLFKENGVKLVLHGHNHEIKEYFRKGIRFLNAGASVENELQNESGLFIIDINENELKVGLDILKQNILETSIKYEGNTLLPSVA